MQVYERLSAPRKRHSAGSRALYVFHEFALSAALCLLGLLPTGLTIFYSQTHTNQKSIREHAMIIIVGRRTGKCACAAQCGGVVGVDFEEVVSHSLPRLSLCDGEEVQHGVVRDVRRIRVAVLIHSPLTERSRHSRGERVGVSGARSQCLSGEPL